MLDGAVISNVSPGRFDLTGDDRAYFEESLEGPIGVDARSDVFRGPSAPYLHILQDGWACKYKLLTDGRRQITSFHLPGEIVDLDRIIQADLSFNILALSECRFARLPLDRVQKAIHERPAIRELLWTLTTSENRALFEQIVSLGRRSARERLAFLLHDLLVRLQDLGIAQDGTFVSYVTQAEMADALGLSTVHLNRTLQGLKADRLIEVHGRTYTIRDAKGLQAVAKA